MKASFLTLFVCFSLAAKAKPSHISADTIAFWHVFYNKTKVKKYNGHNSNEVLVFKTINIKKGDNITVEYFRDTPCDDCSTKLIVEDGKHNIVATGSGKGTFNPISISATELLVHKNQNKTTYFDVYYHESNKRKIFLFWIKLE